MTQVQEAVIIEPKEELRFQGPFNDVVTSNIKVSNTSDNKVCYKIQTTAPKRYCVRPQEGIVDPRSSVTISVMLQPFGYDSNETYKHKFLVQSAFVKADEQDNLDQKWKTTKPENIMAVRLKSVFEMPSSDKQTKPDLRQNNEIDVLSGDLKAGFNIDEASVQDFSVSAATPESSLTPKIGDARVAQGQKALTIEPEEELRFRGPFDDVVTVLMKLGNISRSKVCYRIMTTAPRRYCVRPNGGILDPGNSVDVSVMLQPYDHDHEENHSFLIRYTFIAEHEINNLSEKWKCVTPEEETKVKLKCVFEMPCSSETAKFARSVCKISKLSKDSLNVIGLSFIILFGASCSIFETLKFTGFKVNF